MKTIAIVQARTSSTRLNKVMKKINGTPMIGLLLKRIKHSEYIDEIVVASTTNKEDDQLIKYVNKEGFLSFRGSENNVLDRYYQAASLHNADHIVRLTADCPLLDYRLIDEILKEFNILEADYLSNTIKPMFPDGLDIEVFTIQSLKKAWKHATSSFDLEHVTPYIKNDKSLNVRNYCNAVDLSKLRWTVDEMMI